MNYFNEDGELKIKKVILHIISILAILIILFGTFGTVGAGERGVRLRFGAVTGDIQNEGLYVKIPFIEKIVKMDVKIQKDEVNANAASQDLQTVDSIVALNFHLNHLSVANIYKEFREDYNLRIIAPTIQESVKAATAQFTAEELITKRQNVRDSIKILLREKLDQRGIIVDEFNIVNFNFSHSFNESIEKKVTAEQDALAAKNKLEQIKFEAQQKVEEAKGKAEAITIESNALRANPAILELRALEKWNGILPQVTGGAIHFINIK